MKHFQEDEEMTDNYGSNLFSHWKEDEEMTDNYDSNLFSHWKEDHIDYDEPTIKHFQDD